MDPCYFQFLISHPNHLSSDGRGRVRNPQEWGRSRSETNTPKLRDKELLAHSQGSSFLTSSEGSLLLNLQLRPGNTLIMASEIHMPAPVCLIENIRGHLVANQEALEILAANKNPLVVVAIVGLYRTGKSYLMNKLAGKNKGFSIGTTVQSHTKGIWMWCVPHAKKPNHTLVLLDTEGLGDVEKVILITF
uniref:Guanylate-binding protein 5-like n=1 Tax=Callorhinus ursinus TaxID=34884 RepID=A0A3Q7P1M2_CALUR|nr:guanylate-binding protein 5-like [Callorhinus ursinus]